MKALQGKTVIMRRLRLPYRINILLKKYELNCGDSLDKEFPFVGDGDRSYYVYDGNWVQF